MKALYRFLGKNSALIKYLFYLTYVALISFFVVSIWMYDNFPGARSLFTELDSKFGEVSLVLLLISMTPGILKRLGVLDMIESILLLFRREVGVLAFFTAFMHLGYSSWVRMLAKGQYDLWVILDRQFYGTLAIGIFFILWLISNNWSMKIMRGLWKPVQRLTYVSVILLILHLQFVGSDSKLQILLWIYLGLEAISWLMYWVKKPHLS